MDEMLDQPVGGTLERHLLRGHHIGQRLVELAEFLRRQDVFRTQARGLVADMGKVAFVEDGHCKSPDYGFLPPPPLAPLAGEGWGGAFEAHRSLGGRKPSWPGVASLGG